MGEISDPRWYVVNTRAQSEARVAELLEQRRFDLFFPKYRCLTAAPVPLFPTYLFAAAAAPRELVPALAVPGVLRILGDGTDPAPVRAGIVERLIARSDAIGVLELEPEHRRLVERFGEGDLVSVTAGPLEGLSGTVSRIPVSGGRLWLDLGLLNGGSQVEIDQEWLELVLAAPAGSGVDRTAVAWKRYDKAARGRRR